MTQVLIFTGAGNVAPINRPVGAYRIASELRSKGFTAKVLDHTVQLFRLDPDYFQKAFDRYVTKETLWIGVSTTFLSELEYSADDERKRDIDRLSSPLFSEDLLKRLKSKYPKIKIVYGGSRSFMQMPGIDIYIDGYADTTAVELTKSLAGKLSNIRYSPGIDGSVRVDYDRKASSFDFQNSQTLWHEDDHIFHGESLPIEIARGCIFRCKFCAYPLNGKKKADHIRDPGKLVEEFERNYSLFGTRHYTFADDTFNDSTSKLEMLYNKVFSKLSFKLQFAAYNRIDLLKAHPEQIDLLRDSGIIASYFGFETLNKKAGAAIGKGGDPVQNYNLVEELRTRWPNTNLSGSFIVGLPHDTQGEIEKWGKLAAGRNSPFHCVFFFGLLMNPERERVWRSDLEMNPEKYGYLIPNDRMKTGPTAYWWNQETKMSSITANQLASNLEHLAMLNKKKKLGCFVVPTYLALGVPQDAVLKHSRNTAPFDLFMLNEQEKFDARLLTYKENQLK